MRYGTTPSQYAGIDPADCSTTARYWRWAIDHACMVCGKHLEHAAIKKAEFERLHPGWMPVEKHKSLAQRLYA